MKNILILAAVPFKSGTQLDTFFRIKATALANKKNKIDLITFPYGEDVYIQNLNVIRFPRFKLFKQIMPGDYVKITIYTIFLFLKFILIRKKKYDVIFLYNAILLFGWILKPFIKAKMVVTVYNDLESEARKWCVLNNKLLLKLFRRIDHLILNSYDIIIFGNPMLQFNYRDENKIKQKSKLIDNAFERIKIEKDNFKEDFIVLYAGIFKPIQNLHLIFDAADLIKNRKIKFILIGASLQEYDYYVNLINKKGLENIKIFKWVKNNELSNYYKIADVLISTRVEGNDFPMKIFEYMSTGKCILVTNKPIHTGILDKDYACLFEPTPEDLADKINYLYENPEYRTELANNSLSLFKRKYSFERMIQDYKELLNEL